MKQRLWLFLKCSSVLNSNCKAYWIDAVKLNNFYYVTFHENTNDLFFTELYLHKHSEEIAGIIGVHEMQLCDTNSAPHDVSVSIL